MTIPYKFMIKLKLLINNIFTYSTRVLSSLNHYSMASTMLNHVLFFLLAVIVIFPLAQASNPDILSDFIIPAGNPNAIDGSFFSFTGLRGIFDAPTPPNFKVTKVGMAELPALNGQSVSMAILQYAAGGVNPPHTHPRSAELLFVVDGSLEVGFIDTTNKLYTQTLQSGDIFVFPKGLVHYQYNANAKNPATAISSFGSANARIVSVLATVFATGIDDEILALAFKTDIPTIQKIKAGLAPPKA